MRLTWNRRCWSVFAATVTVLQLAGAARAQYMPYGNQTQPQGYGVQQQGYSAQQPSVSRPDQYSYTYSQQANPQYTAMAAFGNETPTPTPVPTPTPMPAQEYSEVPPQSYPSQTAPMTYGGAGYGTCGDGCNYYNTFEPGCGYGGGCYSGNHCGGSFMMPGSGCGCRWFGGVYGLLMERSRCGCTPLGFVLDAAAPAGSYPTDPDIILYADNAEIGYQGGFEVTFGMYCGGRGGCGPMGRPYGDACGGGMTSCDSCSGGSCGAGGCGCGPTHAWEAGYWMIFEDDGVAYLFDDETDSLRTHGMVDFRGLRYDPGDGFRPVNVFYDYGPPTSDYSTPYDVEVRQLSVRNTFSAQNVEINVMRLPISCGGCCGCRPRCEMTALLGFRIARFDDDFWFRSDYERMDDNTLGYLAYNVEADNTLYGAQIGGSGTYRCGCTGRLAFHVGTKVGLYGNHMEVTQSMASTSGNVEFANGTNDQFVIDGAEDNVAVLGELRLGASYQCHCNWRLYAGWRLIGVSGVAVALDQIPSAFTTPQEVAMIDCDGGFILHGLQTGMEFVY